MVDELSFPTRDARRLVLLSIFLLFHGCSSTESLVWHDAADVDVLSPDGAPSTFPANLYHASQEPFRSFPCLPKHIHIAQATNVDVHSGLFAMTVSFSLAYKTCRSCTPRVIYGRDASPQRSVIGTQPLQFNYTSDKSAGLYQSDWIYHVQLPSLQAGLKQYWYRIVVEEPVAAFGSRPSGSATHRSLRGSSGYYLGETKTYTFLSVPLPGSPTSLALVGDIGQTENSVRTLLGVYQATHTGDGKESGMPPVSQLLIAGDLSYADSNPARWTSWLELVEPLVRSTPLHVVAGNHEIECDTTSHDIFIPYEHWFRNPNRLGRAETVPVDDAYRNTLWHASCSAPSNFEGVYNFGNSFYSYQHGLAHIIVLNSYSDCTVGSVQYQWLASELLRVDRTATPWLLVSFHAPLYTTFLGHVNEIESVKMKQAMEPLFNQYGVNLIISGHDHAYMRTHPLFNNTIDVTRRAPVYLILGAGGNHEGHPWGYRHLEKEVWVAQRTMQDYGYGHWYMANATHARFAWIRDRTTSNEFDDTVWFSNPHVAT